MANHPSRKTRLDDAIDAAHAIIGAGTATLIPGEAAHNAAVVTRFEAALAVLRHAGYAYGDRHGDLAAPAYLRMDASRAEIAKSALALRERAASAEYQ